MPSSWLGRLGTSRLSHIVEHRTGARSSVRWLADRATEAHRRIAHRALRDDLARGGELLGAFADGDVAGLAVVVPSFEGDLAQLSWLHVSRPHRRVGAGSALWEAAAGLARRAGATAMYVSATPTRSAVGFYLRHGCRLADRVHPALYDVEPDDIHLVADLG